MKKPIQIGWVIKHKVDKSYHANIRVYGTEAQASRYSRGLPVLPAYIYVSEDEISVRLWNKEDAN